MLRKEGLVQRKNASSNPDAKPKDVDDTLNKQETEDDVDSKETRLTLMEEVLLLGLKEKEASITRQTKQIGRRSSSCTRSAFGGCQRVKVVPTGMRARVCTLRDNVSANTTSAPFRILLRDGVVEICARSRAVWEDISLSHLVFAGETWNPLKLRYQLRNVRERLAKNLVEKGVLTTEKQNFLLFDMTTHPLVDQTSKGKLVRRVQEAVLGRWVNDPQRMDRRLLALLVLAHASDVLENAFAPLSDEDYELSMRRVRDLLDLDMEAEAAKPNACEVLWGVFAAFVK
ncbi:unnamed protein product [Ixodes hexagonus]